MELLGRPSARIPRSNHVVLQPELVVRDLPPVATFPSLEVKRPEIYYGELSNEYVIVKTKVPEFSYPTATGDIKLIQ